MICGALFNDIECLGALYLLSRTNNFTKLFKKYDVWCFGKYITPVRMAIRHNVVG